MDPTSPNTILGIKFVVRLQFPQMTLNHLRRGADVMTLWRGGQQGRSIIREARLRSRPGASLGRIDYMGTIQQRGFHSRYRASSFNIGPTFAKSA